MAAVKTHVLSILVICCLLRSTSQAEGKTICMQVLGNFSFKFLFNTYKTGLLHSLPSN